MPRKLFESAAHHAFDVAFGIDVCDIKEVDAGLVSGVQNAANRSEVFDRATKSGPSVQRKGADF